MFKRNLSCNFIIIFAFLCTCYSEKFKEKQDENSDSTVKKEAQFQADFDDLKEEALNEIKNNIFRYGAIQPSELSASLAVETMQGPDSPLEKRTEVVEPSKKKPLKKLKARKKLKSKLKLRKTADKLKRKMARRKTRHPWPLCGIVTRRTRNVNRLCKRMEVLAEGGESNDKIQSLLTHLYEAEAKVQMEAGEVGRAQQVALAAQINLEEATNKVRVLSTELLAAQTAAKTAGESAHNAQMELSKHDGQLYDARKKVSKYSNEMVELEGKLAGFIQNDTLPVPDILNPPIDATTSKTTDAGDISAFLPKQKPHCFGPNCNVEAHVKKKYLKN